MDIAPLVDRVPEGWTVVAYDGRGYALTRTTRAAGRGVSLYAEELGGTDVVSANVYRTTGGDVLRPCEMPADKVLAFLDGWAPLSVSRRRRAPPSPPRARRRAAGTAR